MSEIIKPEDKGGETISLLDLDGDYFPPDLQPDVIRDLMKFNFRPDDVIICSYPKTGCHWIWEITRMLLSDCTELDPTEKELCMMEWQSQDTLDPLPSPRVLNTHVLTRQMNPKLLNVRSKIVFMLRNAKDTAVSFYHHHLKLPEYEYKGSWADYLDLFLTGKVDYGSVFDYMRDWERFIEHHPDFPLIVMTYEDLKEDPVREIDRLSQFLNKRQDRDFLQKVADACSFKRMRDRKGHNWLTNGGETIFYRKGEVGDWKNWFTVAQNEHFDKVAQVKMASSCFRLKETIDL
ncbi:sulfotransferase 1B1-like [Littorina saxatilis]|uniref:sulfotransferase 1B1-like n=1 Tax=Littorina saxatilis TaxID=31220 RepID=UPI0038B4CE29